MVGYTHEVTTAPKASLSPAIEDDPVLEGAPELEEPVSEDEERLVAEARAEVAAGAALITHDEAMRGARARLTGE